MGWGLMLERGQGLLLVLEQVQEAAQAYRAKAEVLHQEAAEEVQVGQQEVASLAWARGLPCSWISSSAQTQRTHLVPRDGKPPLNLTAC